MILETDTNRSNQGIWEVEFSFVQVGYGFSGVFQDAIMEIRSSPLPKTKPN